MFGVVAANALARLAGDAGDMATQCRINSSFVVVRGRRSNCDVGRAPDDEVLAGLLLCVELSRRLYELFRPEGGRAAV